MTNKYDLWPPQAFRFKTFQQWTDPLGGFVTTHLLDKKSNAGSAINSLPVPNPSPPVTPANAQVLAAQNAFAKKQLNQYTIGDTIYAGATGGYKPGEAGYPGNPGPQAGFKK